MAALKLPWTLRVLSFLIPFVQAQTPPQPENINITGTAFLDHDKPISGFAGQTLLKENIPYIDIPDTQIQDVYYYRWSSIVRHLRYTTAGTGYILTEFMQPVGYAQALNTIDAAAGHQIDEARWLRGKFYNDDYITVYTRGPGNTTQYTHWIIDAAFRRSQVDGDINFLNEQLADMLRMWDEWDYTFDSDAGLYYFTPNFDAQEYSLPGYVADPSGSTDVQLDGPNTYRPSHNAYMVANARAIAKIATQVGDSSTASNFTKFAVDLENAFYQHLWDPDQQFFMDVIRPNNTNLSTLTGREEVGFYPFRFGIGLAPQYANSSVAAMFDPNGFLTEYGPTTLEVRNQYYDATKPSDYCCFWNGQSWPFSTAHTLKSLAAIYRSGNSSLIADQYVQYLSMYAATQQKNGQPYVAESHYPSMDSWSADSTNHSEHYDHSTNNDDVITDLLGILPQLDNNLVISPIIPQNWTYFAIENLAYHGHLITVIYDQDGSRYGNGSGLTVFVDGVKTYNGNGISATVPLPASSSSSSVVPANIAANPNGVGAYPKANATYTYSTDAPFKANDGYLFYDSVPDNRWTNYQSPNSNDTLQITFPRPRNISSVTLALYSDVSRSGSVDVPASIEIYGSSGLLANLSDANTFVANDRNTFAFTEVETEFVAVNMFNKPNVFVGVCELEVWAPPGSGPDYYAVDALLSRGSVMNDAASTATSNGAVVGDLGSSSVVAFSGIESIGGSSLLSLSYSNSDGGAVAVDVLVNQVSQGQLTLVGNGGKYTSVGMNVDLAAGKNFVSLADGASSVRYEVLSIGKVQGAQVVKKSGALKTSPCHLCWLGLVFFSVMIQ
jgi:hypothetical protein